MQYETKINCAGYVRCSTDQQDDSISQQKNALEEYAQKNNLRIIRYYEDEGKSGTTFDRRPGILKLKEDVENHPPFKVVLVYDESRWSRDINPRQSTYWKQYFESYGVRVLIINTKSSNGNDLASCLIEMMESAQASEYSANLRRVTLRGQISNAEKGYSNGGTAPYGYKRIAVSKATGKYVRDLEPGQHASEDEKVILAPGSPNEILIVKKIFNLRLDGYGYRNIANTLNNENIPCPKRGRWRNKNQRWSHNTINAILSNQIYTGAMVFNRHPQSHLSGPSKRAWWNEEKEWVVKENAHKAIITEEVFELANRARVAYTRNNRFFYDSPYLLSGLLKCKKCGFNFQGQTRKLKSKKGDKEQLIYKYYYEDGGYAGKGNSVCRSNLLRKNEVESVIIKHIVYTINQDNFTEKLSKTIQLKLKSNNDQDQKVNALNKQIEKCNKSLKNLVQMVGSGIDIKEVREEITSIQKERDYLEKELFSLKNETFGEKDVKDLIDKVGLLISDFEKIFWNSPVHIQKKLIRLFVEKIEVDPVSNSIDYYIRNVPWIDEKLNKRFEFGSLEHSVKLYPLIKANRSNAHLISASGSRSKRNAS